MNEHIFYDRKPGENVGSGQIGDDHFIAIGDPDVIRLPPELGGDVVKILETFSGTCPKHKNHKVRTRRLTGDLFVAECDQFYWFQYNKT